MLTLEEALILGGDFFTASVLASTLTKLVLRYNEVAQNAKQANAYRAEVGPVLSWFLNS